MIVSTKPPNFPTSQLLNLFHFSVGVSAGKKLKAYGKRQKNL